MISQETLLQLQHAPMADRLRVIELILQSLKEDIVHDKTNQKACKSFTVRTFNLGEDVQLDREAMYAERGF